MSDIGKVGVDTMSEDRESTASDEKSTPGGPKEPVEDVEEPYVLYMEEAWKLERVIAVARCDSLAEYKDSSGLQNKLAEMITSGEYMHGMQPTSRSSGR